MKTSRQHQFITRQAAILYIIFFISLFFSFRAISTIALAAMLVTGLAGNKILYRRFFPPGSYLFLAICILFFILQFISLIYTDNMVEGWKNIRLKSGLLITPLAVCASINLITEHRRWLWISWCVLLAGASLFCIAAAIIDFTNSNNSKVFFYHQLVSPLKQHAVYFSIYIFVALIFLLEKLKAASSFIPRRYSLPLIIFFSVFLFLLSSKLVLILYGLYIITYLISFNKQNKNQSRWIAVLLLLFIITGSLLLLVDNPVSSRFRDITRGDLALVQKDRYSQGDYFNGLQFRLLQWKLVPHILSEQDAWMTGVSAGDAQDHLDREYTQRNMYTGNPSTGNRGYLGYNTHNQFLEALLQQGIAGLITMLLLGFSLIRMGIQQQKGYGFIILLLLAYALSESVLETQYGIILFTFLPLFTREKI